MEEEKSMKAPVLGLKGRLDSYSLIQELGRGLNAKVYLGQDEKGTLYAIKRLRNMSSANMKAIKNEIDVLKNLEHENVIRLFEFTEGVLHKPNGTSKSGVVYAVIELAQGGEVFQFLMSTGKFPQNIARFYFKAILAGLNYCHTKGYAHRDIKPENLLFNGEFQLKLADFGFATAIAGHDGSGKLRTVLGTESYMAPEIHLKTPYSGSVVDLFASAIVLFIMVTGHPPFNKADPKDPYYLMFCTNRHQRFWDLHSRNKPKGFFSKDFITLINKMLAFDPTQRLSMAEILANPWLNEPTASEAEAAAYMAKNKAAVDADLKRERDEAEAKKKLKQNMRGGAGVGHKGGYRSTTTTQKAFLEENEEYRRYQETKTQFNLDIERTLPIHKPIENDQELKNIRTILDPEDIVKLVLGHFLKANDPKELEAVSLSEKEYKVKGLNYKVSYDEYFSSNVEVGFKVEKVDEDTNAVVFNRLSGDSIAFFKVLKEIRDLFFLAHQHAN